MFTAKDFQIGIFVSVTDYNTDSIPYTCTYFQQQQTIKH